MIEILNSRSKLIFNQFNVEYWIFIILCLSQICSCKLNWKVFEKMEITRDAQSRCAKLNKIKAVEKKNRRINSRCVETLQADGPVIPQSLVAR